MSSHLQSILVSKSKRELRQPAGGRRAVDQGYAKMRFQIDLVVGPMAQRFSSRYSCISPSQQTIVSELEEKVELRTEHFETGTSASQRPIPPEKNYVRKTQINSAMELLRKNISAPGSHHCIPDFCETGASGDEL